MSTGASLLQVKESSAGNDLTTMTNKVFEKLN
jgi:hypothetical protein